jgi:hypothetical protein
MKYSSRSEHLILSPTSLYTVAVRVDGTKLVQIEDHLRSISRHGQMHSDVRRQSDFVVAWS